MGNVVTVYDTVGGIDQIPANAEYFLWYIDGNYRTEAAIKKRFPNAKGLSISVNGSTPADLIDVESGDATVATAVAGVKAGRYKGIYSSVWMWSQFAQALQGHNWWYWSANWTGTPHIDSVAVGTQYAAPDNKTSPGNYDISLAYASLFGVPNPTPAPVIPPPNTILKQLSGRVGVLNAPIVTIASMPSGNGYTLVAADGGTFNYAGAPFVGSLASQHLNAPIIDAVHTPDGKGLIMVATDGGVFCFGTAVFHGGMGGQHINAPVVSIAMSPSGGGYWLTAADGGVFAFGDAPFGGSAA